MAISETKTLLTNLINEGNDAFSNLFLVGVAFDGENTPSFHIRATDVTIPAIGNNTITLPYQNNDFIKVTPGVKFDRRLSIVYRIDDNYTVLKKLQSLLHMSDTAGSDFHQTTSDKSFTVTVTVMKNLGTDALIYTFKNCRLENIHELTYSYSNSNGLTTGNLGIIFTDMSIADASANAS